MKIWIVLLGGMLILTTVSLYILIPSPITVSELGTSQTTMEAEYRFISQEFQWQKWWKDADGKSHTPGNPFSYDGMNYRITKEINNAVGIEIDLNGVKYHSVIHLIAFSQDSIGAIWRCELPAGINPVTRWQQFRNGRRMGRNMTGILKNLSRYISNPRNVYGFSFFRTSIRDSTMLSSRFISAAYPTNTELYSYIDIIVKNIKKQKGAVSGKPLINVEKLPNGSFETQVAIPTLHELKDDGNIVFRRMVPGNFLCAEVYGGAYTAEEALRQMHYFIADNHKSKQANAFQILLTDRRSEPDTLKWLTKIYIPVSNSDLPPKQ